MKMKRHILTALIIFLVLNVLTIIGGFASKTFRYSYGSNIFLDTIVIKLIFSIIFYLTTLIKVKVNVSLRLPIIRTILWSAFVVPEFFWQPVMYGEPSMMLYDTNEGICNLYHFIWQIFNDNCIGCDLWIDTILPGIIIFGLFEYLVIKFSDTLSFKILTRKISLTSPKTLEQNEQFD